MPSYAMKKIGSVIPNQRSSTAEVLANTEMKLKATGRKLYLILKESSDERDSNNAQFVRYKNIMSSDVTLLG